MRTLRNAAFAVLLMVGLWVGQDPLLAFNPTFYPCPGGCTCDIDPFDWHYVTIDCPNDPSIDICPYLSTPVTNYCADLATAIDAYNWSAYSQCTLTACDADIDFCPPYGLYPPTYITLFCDCLTIEC